MKYFETKVIKVKKCEHKQVDFRGSFIKCCKCGHIMSMQNEEPKGNWVNGENLDKIKFPCYCIFDSNKVINGSDSGQCVKGIGRIDKTWDDIAYKEEYQISIADHQTKDLSVICSTPSLKRLFEIYRPKILKAKLILYEEEK